jgi:hypothetical protein
VAFEICPFSPSQTTRQPLLAIESGALTVLSSSYAHFFAGRFIKETDAGKDVEFMTTWPAYQFRLCRIQYA